MFKVENIKYVKNNLQIFQIKFLILVIMKQAAILNEIISSFSETKFFVSWAKNIENTQTAVGKWS